MNDTTPSTPWVCRYPAEQPDHGHQDTTPARYLVQLLELSAAGGLVAGALYAFSTVSAGGGQMLSALAGTSALIYLELLLESRTWVRRLINLITPPAIFTAAYFSLNGPPAMLAAAFLLHTLATSAQIRNQGRDRVGLLWFWVAFNAVLAVLVVA